jgi:hypothetical protein
MIMVAGAGLTTREAATARTTRITSTMGVTLVLTMTTIMVIQEDILQGESSRIVLCWLISNNNRSNCLDLL